MFYLQLELPSDQETKSGFAAEPGCCFLALQVTWVGSAPKSKPLPFYIPFLTENVPPGTPDILASHTGVPPLPTKRGEKSPAWEATSSQSHRRSKIIKIIPLHGFGMLNLVPRIFSFSGMPVVTTHTVPWTSYRRIFRVCKARRVYFIQFHFYSWAIRGILETWSCQSTKVSQKKWKKKKKKPTEFCLPFFVVLL